MLRPVSLLGALLLFPCVAQAQPGIWFTLGDIEADAPPNRRLDGGSNPAEYGRVFRQSRDADGLTLPSGTDLRYDIEEGRYGRGEGPADTVATYTAGGGSYRVYLAHFDHAGEGRYRGGIVFDEEIVAVIAGTRLLEQFESDRGVPVDYDLPSDPTRGLELSGADDEDFIERGGPFSIKFDLSTNSESDPIDQFRVITREPRRDAEVVVDCPGDVVAVDGVAVISGGFDNLGTEPSPPVLLLVTNNGASATMGELRADGVPVDCELFREASLCPLGMALPGSHSLDGELMAPAGTILQVSVSLFGSSSEICDVRVIFPADALPSDDPGPTFGGAGARCASTAGGTRPGVALFALALTGAALSWRRR